MSVHAQDEVLLEFVEGDTLPELVGTYKGQDLSGYTITMHIARCDGTTLIKTATPIDLTQGQFKFTWSATDHIAGKGQKAEIQFVTPGAEPLPVQGITINVSKAIA